GGETHSEAHNHRRAGPFLLACQHESRRSTREVSVILEYVVGLFHLGRIHIEVQWRANASENFCAASVNHAIVNLAKIRNWRLWIVQHIIYGRDCIVRA